MAVRRGRDDPVAVSTRRESESEAEGEGSGGLGARPQDAGMHAGISPDVAGARYPAMGLVGTGTVPRVRGGVEQRPRNASSYLSSRGLRCERLDQQRKTIRARWRLRERMASRQLLPSAILRAMYALAGGWQRTWTRAITWRARLSWRLPPRLRRIRWVWPELAGIGATPASIANASADRKRPDVAGLGHAARRP